MSHSNGTNDAYAAFGMTAFEPIWHYFRCDKCRRVLVTVQTVRGDHPPQFRCPTLPGSRPVNGKPCEGHLVMNDERKMRDWPVFARHVPDAEWYKPANDELRKIKRAAPKLWAYIMGGGLIARAPKGAFPWPLAGPQVPHEPIQPDPLPPGTPACPDCGAPLLEGLCRIHGNPNDTDPSGVLL
jgi:hypothetical protein